MTKRHRRTKDNRMLLNREPIGYYKIIDHDIEVSVIRFYTEDERTEIKALSEQAQAQCTELHQGKPGKCCVLWTSDKEEWTKWH